MYEIFERRESQVRSYCRNFPIEFLRAKGAELYSKEGERYIDFFAGAGAMNFGHNNPYIKEKILEYLAEDNIIHALDMFTVPKEHFLETFEERILKPRGLDFKIMCCGATGTNAVEAAIKLARKNKKRTNVIAFAGAFHGMSLGSLAMTSDEHSRGGAGVPLNNVTFVPYADHFDTWEQSLAYLEWVLTDDHSGVDKPAAIVLETVQAEGGINVAPVGWLQGVRALCDKHDIVMICDDIQVGVGRTGYFFSWERAGIVPDMVTMSKSISGFGLPMSIVLLKPELDIFTPGEHNGTFRGHQLSFIGSAAGMEYFTDHHLDEEVRRKEKLVREFMEKEILPIDERLQVRGIGLIWGIDFSGIDPALSKTVMQECVKRHLIIERAGRGDCVLKPLPPLVISDELLLEGFQIIKESMLAVLK